MRSGASPHRRGVASMLAEILVREAVAATTLRDVQPEDSGGISRARYGSRIDG